MRHQARLFDSIFDSGVSFNTLHMTANAPTFDKSPTKGGTPPHMGGVSSFREKFIKPAGRDFPLPVKLPDSR